MAGPGFWRLNLEDDLYLAASSTPVIEGCPQFDADSHKERAPCLVSVIPLSFLLASLVTAVTALRADDHSFS